MLNKAIQTAVVVGWVERSEAHLFVDGAGFSAVDFTGRLKDTFHRDALCSRLLGLC
jgi:hypothetical protein